MYTGREQAVINYRNLFFTFSKDFFLNLKSTYLLETLEFLHIKRFNPVKNYYIQKHRYTLYAPRKHGNICVLKETMIVQTYYFVIIYVKTNKNKMLLCILALNLN